MSMIKDGKCLSMVTIPSPQHDLVSYMDRILFEIADAYRKEMQDDWSKEDQLRAEGVRATFQTLKEALKAYKEHEVNNG